MDNDFIYLDYNATTPTDQRVVEEMIPYFTQIYGNSGSSHLIGLSIREEVEQAI